MFLEVGGWGRLSALTALLLSAAVPQAAVSQTRSTLNFNGVTGLIDMPSAEMQPDGELSTTAAFFAGSGRGTLTFQITDRLQGSFRYSGVSDLVLGGYGKGDVYYDRSFDLRFLLLREGEFWPAVTVGLQDFVGTGLRSGEYLVATKNVSPGLKLTGGIGWGRYGSYKPFGSIGARDGTVSGTGGTFNVKNFFRGDVAPFAGVEWQVNEKLGLKFEYSSDAYLEEAGRQALFDRKTPFNFGAEYQVSDTLRLGAYYLYGSEVGVSAQFFFNPARPLMSGYRGPAPLPVAVRQPKASNPQLWSEGWAAGDRRQAGEGVNKWVSDQMQAQGLQLQHLTVVSPNQAEVRIANLRYDATAQAVGRAARALATSLPSSVEIFDIVLVVNGMPTSRTRIRRSDLERLEYAPNAAGDLWVRSQISDAVGPIPAEAVRGLNAAPRFSWGLSPYVRYGFFDPDAPLRADVGLRLRAALQLAEGVTLTGSVTHRFAGNLDEYDRPGGSRLAEVRTKDYLRSRRDTELERLTLSWQARPGESLYSRVSAGYLERGFAGVSGELLWKPIDSRLALGVEASYVKQRDFDSLAGLGDYSVATGHASAYYDFQNGYLAQLDVGRYLAGDLGATLSLDREFANGWRVGAFATKTNVSAEEFGEGSFDKGIRLRIPLAWLTGSPRRSSIGSTIRPIQRDGGARLNLSDRLYDAVRDTHQPKLDEQWGRVWR